MNLKDLWHEAKKTDYIEFWDAFAASRFADAIAFVAFAVVWTALYDYYIPWLIGLGFIANLCFMER